MSTPSVAHHDRIARLRRWSNLLDSAFRVPGTRLRFGWDALVGLVPGVGDLATAAFSGLLLIEAFRSPLPRIIQARMICNVLIDLAIGAVPLVGDLFDFVWKANRKNLLLLERHGYARERPARGDWLVVAATATLLVAAVVVPLLIARLVFDAIAPGWVGTGPDWRLLLAF
jgi:hypothetical protein